MAADAVFGTNSSDGVGRCLTLNGVKAGRGVSLNIYLHKILPVLALPTGLMIQGSRQKVQGSRDKVQVKSKTKTKAKDRGKGKDRFKV